MSNTQERIKKRREYLKNKGVAYTTMSLSALLAAPFIVIAVLVLVASISVLGQVYDQYPQLGMIVLSIMAFVAVCMGLIAWLFMRNAHRARQEARQLPYVPPVNAESLPAEEVLLRGAEEPAQEQSKVLLRGANSSTSTDKQELLRGSMWQEEAPDGRTKKAPQQILARR